MLSGGAGRLWMHNARKKHTHTHTHTHITAISHPDLQAMWEAFCLGGGILGMIGWFALTALGGSGTLSRSVRDSTLL